MSARGSIRWAERSRPIGGEVQSGDAQVVAPFSTGVLLAVIDGLGHGPEAAAAARLAATVLREDPALAPAEQIARCHAALKGTRGAAMLVASVSFQVEAVTWAGVGNVEGWRVSAGKREAMISRAGVVGYQITTPANRSEPLRPGDLLILASDGISSGFLESVTTGGELEQLAATILERHARPTDDALVLVARYEAGAAP